MATPDAVKYEMTHAAGSGVLPRTSVPINLSRGRSFLAARVPAVVDRAATTSSPIFEAGPTTLAARWMCRRGNRGWGFPLAILAALGYAGAAWFLFEVNHMVTWVFVALFAYNAAKFAVVAGWLAVAGFSGLVRKAFNAEPHPVQ